jgi:broad specificity phosphatase PhoE
MSKEASSSSGGSRRSSETLTLVLIRHAESQNNYLSDQYPEISKYVRYSDSPLSKRGNEQIQILEEVLKYNHLPTCVKLRSSVSNDSNGVKIYTSPMRRALKTASYVSSGLNKKVIVHPLMFEEGGCYHEYPELSEESGLKQLMANNTVAAAPENEEGNDVYQFKKHTNYSGATKGQVLSTRYLSKFLNIVDDRQTNFIESVLPGMDNGWYTSSSSFCETRSECFDRAGLFVQHVRDLAMNVVENEQRTNTIILVSHGDLMDCILKQLLHRGGRGGNTLTDREIDHMTRYVHCNTGMTRLEINREDGTAHLITLNEHSHVSLNNHYSGGEMSNGWGEWRTERVWSFSDESAMVNDDGGKGGAGGATLTSKRKEMYLDGSSAAHQALEKLYNENIGNFTQLVQMVHQLHPQYGVLDIKKIMKYSPKTSKAFAWQCIEGYYVLDEKEGEKKEVLTLLQNEKRKTVHQNKINNEKSLQSNKTFEQEQEMWLRSPSSETSLSTTTTSIKLSVDDDEEITPPRFKLSKETMSPLQLRNEQVKERRKNIIKMKQRKLKQNLLKKNTINNRSLLKTDEVKTKDEIDVEINRLETLLSTNMSSASKIGIKKQIAKLKAINIRKRRKMQQKKREEDLKIQNEIGVVPTNMIEEVNAMWKSGR